MEVLYSTEATAEGDRRGRVSSSDGVIDMPLSMPKGLGGPGGDGTNPEQLFAAAYAACFESALNLVAREENADVSGASITARVHIGHPPTAVSGWRRRSSATSRTSRRRKPRSLWRKRMESAHTPARRRGTSKSSFPWMSEGMGDANNVEAAREMYRLFERRDNEGIRNLFAPDIKWIQMEGFPGGGRYVGADAIFDGVFFGFREEWEGWRAVVETFLDAGKSVVVLGFYEGTYMNTGRSTRAEFAHVLEFENDRIARFVQYTDTFKVAEAMGVVEGGE